MKKFLLALCVVAAFFEAANAKPQVAHAVGRAVHAMAVK